MNVVTAAVGGVLAVLLVSAFGLGLPGAIIVGVLCGVGFGALGARRGA